MPERSALVVTTAAAAGVRTNGASLRVDEVVRLLEETGHSVARATTGELRRAPRRVDLAVAVSYACAGVLPELTRRAPRVWLDVVDSWLLVDGSGLRSGRPGYALRGIRDGWRLATMPRPDLVTWISRADLAHDRGTVRGRRRLVLPGRQPAAGALGAGGTGRRVVLAADWTYAPNRDGLTWFCRRVLPRLRAQLSAMEGHVAVYGIGAPDVGGAPVRVHGYSAVATDLYCRGDVHAAPVRFGGGVKRKVLSPLLVGLPVVTTTVGAHGLRAHPLLAVHDDPVGFADALVRCLRRPCPTPAGVPAAELLDADDSAQVAGWLRS